MVRHRWKDDVCVNCGVKRSRAERKKFVRDRSVLINGVWEDSPVFKYDISWLYWKDDKKGTFERPDCITKVNS